MSRRRTSAGFTLMELILVAANIAVLAIIALPTYQDYLVRTHVTEGVTLAAGAQTAKSNHVSSTGRLPKSNAEAGLATNASINGGYVSGVDLASKGQVVVTFNEPKASQ